jgi:hypothetical protein
MDVNCLYKFRGKFCIVVEDCIYILEFTYEFQILMHVFSQIHIFSTITNKYPSRKYTNI